MLQKITGISRSIVHLTADRHYPNGDIHNKKAIGTGFLWRHDKKLFLVTNWHNLTGVRPDNLQISASFFPNRITFRFFVFQERNDGLQTVFIREREVDLFDANDRPVWVEHARRSAVDVAAIEMTNHVESTEVAYCLNDADFEMRWKPEVGSECFVVGFPEGLSGPSNTPIWKRASIATEPNFPTDEAPEVLIDTLGNEGLSGSPVISQASGVFNPDGSSEVRLNSVIGTWRTFLGVYAGRTSEAGVGFQLGRVWKAEFLTELLLSGVPGQHPSFD